jgi:pimeloyl-ACP methyl ester carboxylesterase
MLAALSSHAVAQAPAGTAPHPAAGAAADVAPGVVPRFEPVPRGAFPVVLNKDDRIDTGYLVVYEDRARRGGRTIRLPVAILRSKSTRPAPDPVVYTAGGPGASSLSAAQYGGAYRFTDTRDLIVVEQRGTRHAEPALACPEVRTSKAEAARRGLDAAGRAGLDAEAAARCRARLVAAGVDPAAYTTAASAADLEDLRRVLGIARWNLYGVSYSTRLMLAVLRDHGAAVRSAVLDSPLPPTVRYDDASAGHFAGALDVVLRDCDAQPDCRAAYPTCARASTRRSRPPTPGRWRSPCGARWTAARSRWRCAARRSPAGRARQRVGPPVPAAHDGPDRAARHGRAPRGGRAHAVAGRRVRLGHALLGVVRRGAPYARRTPAAAQRGSRPSWRGSTPRRRRRRCARVAGAAGAARDTAAVRSAVPVLLVSGAYDPETPPAWAAAAARTLPNARVLTLPGMTHVPTQMWDAPCAMQLAAAFVDDPTRDPAAGPAGACLAALRPPAFVTARPGPPRAGAR